MTSEDVARLDERLRENEAQTREQTVQIAALAKSNHEYVDIIREMLDRNDRREEKASSREDKFWKTLWIALATIVALALGPKVAEKIMTFGVAQYIAPLNYDRFNHTEEYIA